MLPIQMLFLNPLFFVLFAAALVISISVHECAHAYVAYKLGDPTAKNMGRITLNPKAHLDPLGTVMLIFAGFGWGRPVVFDPSNLKNPKVGAALISFAGPASNFLLAFIFSLTIKASLGFTSFTIVHGFLYTVIYYNLVLGFFNLIPIHPLDGFKIVNGFLPEDLSLQWIQTAQYGIYILLLLVLTNTTGKIILPLIQSTLKIFGINY